MKVAIVAGPPARWHEVGDQAAAEHYGTRLASALSACGDDVTLYVRRTISEGAASANCVDGVRSVLVPAGPVSDLPQRETLPLMGEFAQYLNTAWLADRPDVVHAHAWLPGLAAALAAGRHAIPTVQSFHGLAAASDCNGEASRRRLEILLAKSATWVIAGSTDEMTTLAGMRRSRARMSVVGGAVDIEQFAPMAIGTHGGYGRRIVGLAAGTGPGCGLDVVIHALSKLRGLELVGAITQPSRERPDALRRLAVEAGVADRVTFVEAFDSDALAPLLESADMVTHTPWSAPTAVPVLEAMASGIPVVATAVGALADTVVDQVTGFLVPPGNSAGVARALKMLASQSFRRQSMGAAGRARVAARYTWQRVATESRAAYEQAVQMGPRTAVAGQAARG
jgi:glycosyltransferase involved in cell wall biosynthesis